MHIHVDLIIGQRLKLLALTGQARMGVEHINTCQCQMSVHIRCLHAEMKPPTRLQKLIGCYLQCINIKVESPH